MVRIGIICPSEIAYRRFSPALKAHSSDFLFSGIGKASAEEWYGKDITFDKKVNEERLNRETAKCQTFIDFFGGGKIYDSYEDLVTSDDIDAVYLPLPPALHYRWAKVALQHGKHVFVEKPSTTDAKDTAELIKLATTYNLAFHENYMFIYHNQLKAVNDIVNSGELGDVRLYRISFGFPRRAQNDFRYNKALGGGALIDAGGYTLKYASYLLGETAELKTAQLNYLPEFEVDMYGSATMVNADGVTAQLAFGMDNDYKCEIEIWGSKGTLSSNRILTAPVGFVPECTIKKNQDYETRKLPADDAFGKSIDRFLECIQTSDTREEEYRLVQREADLMTQFKDMAK
jgi:NDP-hexose-3-ketoreductase